jgi:HD-like signal output (HDOD) protein
MKIIFVILFSLGCFVLFFLLYYNKKSTPPPRRKKYNTHPPGGSAPPSNKNATHTSDIYNRPLHRIVKIKADVLNGIDYILSGYRLDDIKSTLPLQRKEIRQEIVSKIKTHVGGMKEFSSFDELSRLLDDPDVAISKIAKKISTDPVLSNKILKIANSSYFGSSVAVDSINHALSMLGLVNIKAILFHNAFSNKLSGGKASNPFYQSLWGHSISTATCAFHMSDALGGLHKGKLYTLGLVHDIGKFIIPEMDRSRQDDDCFITPYGEKTSISREDACFGINHAVIGRIAFEDSGLSEQLLWLIEYHHFPSYGSNSYFVSTEEDKRYLAGLYLANQIAKLFARDEEKQLFAVQPIPAVLGNLVNRPMLEGIFSDDRVLSDIVKSKSLTESYI